MFGALSAAFKVRVEDSAPCSESGRAVQKGEVRLGWVRWAKSAKCGSGGLAARITARPSDGPVACARPVQSATAGAQSEIASAVRTAILRWAGNSVMYHAARNASNPESPPTHVEVKLSAPEFYFVQVSGVGA